MILTLQSFSNPVIIDTREIIAFIWSIELAKIEIVLRNGAKVPIDQSLYELEEQYQDKLSNGDK
jgi:hypothetical protein